MYCTVAIKPLLFKFLKVDNKQTVNDCLGLNGVAESLIVVLVNKMLGGFYRSKALKIRMFLNMKLVSH